jgi:hypothetical protein
VTTLRQWGEQIFPEGKHQGASFIQVYNRDVKYTTYMKSHSHLTSPWAMSFQNFVKAMAMPPENLQTSQAISKAAGTSSSTSSEWDVMGSPAQKQMPTMPSSTKRGAPEPTLDEIQDIMELEKDVEKEQKILTQMAILQRELDRLKQPEKQ